MKRTSILLLLVGMLLAALNQTMPMLDSEGTARTGHVRATLLVYSQPDGGDLIWTGTTDGSLPALRLENGYIHNIDNILPGYVRDRAELWIEVVIDGRTATDGRMRYTSSSDRSLHRDTPADPGEVSETLVDELQIGLPGHELYVASATTGFGVDAPVEKVDIDGAVGLKGMTSLPSPTTDFGKVYVDDSDGHLYFMDEGGTSTDLLETTATTGGGTFLAALEENMLHACIGSELWLDVHLARGTDPYTHLWTGDTGPLSATNIPNPIFNASTAGLYQLTYTITDGDGNSSEFLTYVRVHPDPTPSVTSRPVSGGCVGEPVTLIGDGCYARYCWEEGPCSKVFDVEEGGTYNLTVMDEWGCTGTASHSVTFLDPPVANAGANASECSGGTNPVLGGSPAATGGTSPYTYTWTGSAAAYLSSPTDANPSFNVSSASPGVYSAMLAVTDVNGCTDTDGPVVVTVFALPIASVSATTPVCPGDPISLSGGATGGVGPYSYSWTGPSGFTSFIQNPVISSAAPSNAGTYTLVATDANGCSSIGTDVAVSLNTPVYFTVSPADVTLCEGLDAGFSVTVSGTGPFTYQWQRNPGSGWTSISGATASTYTQTSITPSMDGYAFRCISEGLCAPSDTSTAGTLTVNEAPEVTSSPSDTTVDDGTSATFNVSATGHGLTFQWQQSTDGGSTWANVGSSSTSYTISGATESMTGYQYRCIVSGTCSPPDTSAAATLTVTTGLYTFTSHTFSNCGKTGRLGPSLVQCRSYYTTSWDEDAAFFDVTATGIQIWTVPEDATYRITAAGAQGGTASGVAGGRGAIVRGDFVLSRGDKIKILVGQMGQDSPGTYGAASGGGSFVATLANVSMIVGAGGSGMSNGYGCSTANADASYTYSTATPSYDSGVGRDTAGGGGAGFSDNARNDGSGTQTVAESFVNGGEGGDGPLDGGFGGGGGHASGNALGSGGGGYTGGDEFYNCATYCGSLCSYGNLMNAGSYNAGTSTANIGTNTGHGYVIVEKL